MWWRTLVAVVALAGASLACTLGAEPTSAPTPTTALATLSQTETGGVIVVENTLQPTPGQACSPRADWQTTVILPGDTLSGIAQRSGITVDELVNANCLSSPDSIIAGQSLRVPVALANPTPGDVSDLPSNCSGDNQWFFTFAYAPVDNNCPGQLISGNAVGQNFQNGRIYRYDPAPGETQATIYVIYNDSTWTAFPDTWDSSQLSDDSSIVPPAGWYKPTGALGKLWREQLRDRLGWAYAPEDTFSGRRQAPVNSVPYLYIDHGLRRLVLRLNNTNRTWQVVGSY